MFHLKDWMVDATIAGSTAKNDCANRCCGDDTGVICYEDLGCGCNEAGPSGCDYECGSTAILDCNGDCGGTAVDNGCGCSLCGNTRTDCRYFQDTDCDDGAHHTTSHF